jgi:DNA repair protein RecO (recombination protein O)
VPVISTEAIVLQTFAYGDTSRILRLLTATHGLQSAIARGARRPRSQYGGLLEAFSRGTATLHIRENRDLQTLSGFDLSHSGQALGRDLMRFGGAALLSEVVLRATREEPQPGLFDLVADSLDRLERVDAAEAEAMALGRVWRLVALLGFAPELEACVPCGRTVQGDEIRFDYAAGGVRCDDCSRGAPGRTVPANAIDAIRTMIAGRDVALAETRGHWWLLTRWLDHHVLEGATLQSLEFIAAARDDASCDN